QPTEVLESRFPLRIESSALATNSAGDGRHRGGLAMRRELRLCGPEASYSVLADGAVLPAFGILGAWSGVPVGSHVVRQRREVRFTTPGKVSGFRMIECDVLVLQSAGGGGYGDPPERDPELVLVAVRRRRVCPMNPADARRNGFRARDLVELVAPRAAPLGAWVVVDRKIRPGSVPLDPIGQRVLGLGPGARLHVRLIADTREGNRW